MIVRVESNEGQVLAFLRVDDVCDDHGVIGWEYSDQHATRDGNIWEQRTHLMNAARALMAAVKVK